jgi:hypothetical protein
MTREIVIRIPEERAREMLAKLEGVMTLAAIHGANHNNLAELADLRDLLQRAVDEAAAERLRQERD